MKYFIEFIKNADIVRAYSPPAPTPLPCHQTGTPRQTLVVVRVHMYAYYLNASVNVCAVYL